MNGGLSSRYQESGGALRSDTGHRSHRLPPLEMGGLSVIGHACGKADDLMLTPDAQTWARQGTRSCGEGCKA
jgi:hypothetical protein